MLNLAATMLNFVPSNICTVYGIEFFHFVWDIRDMVPHQFKGTQCVRLRHKM